MEVVAPFYKRHPAAVEADSESGVAIWRVDREAVYQLNDTGAAIWRSLREGRSVEKMAANISSAYAIERCVAAQHVSEFVQTLAAVELIEATTELSSSEMVKTPQSGDRHAALLFAGQAVSPFCPPPIVGDDGDGRFWEAVVQAVFRLRAYGAVFERCRHYRDIIERWPKWVIEHWSALAQINRRRNERITAQAEETISLLNGAGIEPLMVKGMAQLFGNTYPAAGVRVIGDIDLLVPEREIPRAVAVLENAGYVKRPAKGVDYDNMHHHAAPLYRADAEVPVEIHRAPLARRLDAVLPGEQVWRRSGSVRHPVLHFRVPDPTAQVLHAIAHAQLQDNHYELGSLPMKELTEYAWLVYRYRSEIDWEYMEKALMKYRRHYAAFAYIAERLLQVPMPARLTAGPAARLSLERTIGAERWPALAMWQERIHRYRQTGFSCLQRRKKRSPSGSGA